MKSYYVKLLAFSVLIFTAAFLAAQKFNMPLYYVVLLSVFFTSFSFILNKQLQDALQAENKNKFTNTFLALTALKMFSCLFILLFGLYFIKDSHLAIGICTMSYYMLYTALEVWHWLSRLKQS
jgi:O-antigen/teichoic acid export membrane protein